MQAVAQQGFIQPADAYAADQRTQQKVVIMHIAIGRKIAHALQNFATHDHVRGGHEYVAQQQRACPILGVLSALFQRMKRIQPPMLFDDLLAVVNQLDVRPQKIQLMRLHMGDAALQTLRMVEVIGVDDGQPCTARPLQPLIQRGMSAQVAFMAQTAQTGIVERGNLLPAGIRRSIVDHNEFELNIVLFKHAVNGLGHESGMVVHRHNDADEGLLARAHV